MTQTVLTFFSIVGFDFFPRNWFYLMYPSLKFLNKEKNLHKTAASVLFFSDHTDSLNLFSLGVIVRYKQSNEVLLSLLFPDS